MFIWGIYSKYGKMVSILIWYFWISKTVFYFDFTGTFRSVAGSTSMLVGKKWCNFHPKNPCGGSSTSHTWKENKSSSKPSHFLGLASMWIFMGCFCYPWVKKIELETPHTPVVSKSVPSKASRSGHFLKRKRNTPGSLEVIQTHLINEKTLVVQGI